MGAKEPLESRRGLPGAFPWLLSLALLLLPAAAQAQLREGQFLGVSAGLGGSSVEWGDTFVQGTGFFAEADYVLALKSWVGLRPYAAVLATWPDENEPPCFAESGGHCEATMKAVLFGGKGRFAAPIPWVAPFIELGFGLSLGQFRTRLPDRTFDHTGVLAHGQFTIGLALGSEHDVELALTTFDESAAHQLGLALSVGLSFSLECPSYAQPGAAAPESGSWGPPNARH